MKYIIIFALFFGAGLYVHAQNTAPPPGDSQAPHLKVESTDDSLKVKSRKVDVKVQDNERKVNVRGPIDVDYYESDTSTESTTIVRIGNWKVKVDEGEDGDRVEIVKDTSQRTLKNVRTKFGLFDLGVNTYLYNGGLQIPGPYEELEDLNYWKSTHFALHLVKQRVNIAKHKLHFTYGLSFNFNNYNYTKDFTIVPESETLTLSPDSIDYKKNKLHTLFFSLPAQFGYESNPYNRKRSFRIGAGGSFGILAKGKTKQKSKSDGKNKQKDNFNLNKIRYGVNTYIGYGWLNFYANYYFSPLFDKQEAPELLPLEFGIVLRGF